MKWIVAFGLCIAVSLATPQEPSRRAIKSIVVRLEDDRDDVVKEFPHKYRDVKRFQQDRDDSYAQSYHDREDAGRSFDDDREDSDSQFEHDREDSDSGFDDDRDDSDARSDDDREDAGRSSDYDREDAGRSFDDDREDSDSQFENDREDSSSFEHDRDDSDERADDDREDAGRSSQDRYNEASAEGFEDGDSYGDSSHDNREGYGRGGGESYKIKSSDINPTALAAAFNGLIAMIPESFSANFVFDDAVFDDYTHKLKHAIKSALHTTPNKIEVSSTGPGGLKTVAKELVALAIHHLSDPGSSQVDVKVLPPAHNSFRAVTRGGPIAKLRLSHVKISRGKKLYRGMGGVLPPFRLRASAQRLASQAVVDKLPADGTLKVTFVPKVYPVDSKHVRLGDVNIAFVPSRNDNSFLF